MTLPVYLLFANRFWVQKNKMKEDKFSIIPTDYSFNNISVIRALGCNEESMYWNEENSVIPNIFYTTSEEDLSVQSILLLKYFEKKRNNEYYGINSETIFDIKRELSFVFSTDDVAKFYRCIELLFECKVLRKSIYDIDDLKNLGKKESLSDDSMLYISPRGTELYEMFKRDSVLLEMLREDVWRDYSGWNYIGKTSNELMQERKRSTRRRRIRRRRRVVMTQLGPPNSPTLKQDPHTRRKPSRPPSTHNTF